MSSVAEKLLTRDEVAKMLGVCNHTVLKWDKSGRLRSIRITQRTLRYKLSEVERFISDHVFQPEVEV
jgi:excisionase family DNA binding protein